MNQLQQPKHTIYPKLCPLPLALAVADKALYDFSNKWLAGLRPQLSLETGPDCQIWVSSRVVAGDVPPHAKLVLRQHAAEEAGPHHCHRLRHHGPSQQRRRLRRESPRAASETADKAVEKAEPAVKTADTAKNDVPPVLKKLPNLQQLQPGSCCKSSTSHPPAQSSSS
jgi:hypothetical protein